MLAKLNILVDARTSRWTRPFRSALAVNAECAVEARLYAARAWLCAGTFDLAYGTRIASRRDLSHDR